MIHDSWYEFPKTKFPKKPQQQQPQPLWLPPPLPEMFEPQDQEKLGFKDDFSIGILNW